MSEGILTIRPMYWDEAEAHDEFNKKWRDQHPDAKDFDAVKACALWVLENIYDVKPGLLTPAEVMTVYRATLIRSGEVREDEIKNLPPSLLGISNAADIAVIAENSKSNGENTLTAEPATGGSQM